MLGFLIKLYPIPMVALLFLVALLFTPAGAVDRVKASYAAVNASQAPLWMALDRGFFAKHGLEVDLVFISSGSLNVQALVGNTVQFAAGGAVQRLRRTRLDRDVHRGDQCQARCRRPAALQAQDDSARSGDVGLGRRCCIR